MAFTIHDFQDMIRLLEQHPEWLAQLRATVFTQELLQLPKTVQGLSGAHAQTEERLQALIEIVKELAIFQKHTSELIQTLSQRVDELAAAQKRTEESLQALSQRFDELAAAQQRTEEQVRELTAAQKRTEESLQALSQRVDELAAAQQRTEERLDRLENELNTARIEFRTEIEKTRSELARLSDKLGVSLEDEAASVLATIMRQKGYRVLSQEHTLRFNGDIDVIFPVEDSQGRRIWVLAEVKARLSGQNIHAWAQRIRSEKWRKALLKAGCQPPYLIYAYGIRLDISAYEAAKQLGIGLAKGDGEIYPPASEEM